MNRTGNSLRILCAVSCCIAAALSLSACSSSHSAATQSTTPVQGCDFKIVTAVSQLVGADGSQVASNQVTLRLVSEYGQAFMQAAILPVSADVLPIAVQQGTRAAMLQAGTEAHRYCEASFGPTTTAPPPPSTTQPSWPLNLNTSGGLSGVESAMDQAFVGGMFEGLDNPTVTCGPQNVQLTPDAYVLCKAVAIGGESDLFLIQVKSDDGKTIQIPRPTQITCDGLSPGQAAAVEAYEGSATCIDPNGVVVPSNAQVASQDLQMVVFSAPLPSGAPITQEDLGGADIYEVVDPHDSTWAIFFIAPSPASTGAFKTTAGLVQQVGGTWSIVSGPTTDLGCGIPASVPAPVLTALGVVRSSGCP
jgi:hypothetical protein